MHEKGITRAQLAEAMGVSRPRITQMFSSECTNLTVRLFARALNAMGEKPEVTCATFRKVKQRQAFADLLDATRDGVPSWAITWEHASTPANDHGVIDDDIEVAAGETTRRVNSLVADSLRRTFGRRAAA
jgi:transcriptional regulator with XRE-family HTH domain